MRHEIQTFLSLMKPSLKFPTNNVEIWRQNKSKERWSSERHKCVGTPLILAYHKHSEITQVCLSVTNIFICSQAHRWMHDNHCGLLKAVVIVEGKCYVNDTKRCWFVFSVYRSSQLWIHTSFLPFIYQIDAKHTAFWQHYWLLNALTWWHMLAWVRWDELIFLP